MVQGNRPIEQLSSFSGKMSFSCTCRWIICFVELIHFTYYLGKQAASVQKLKILRQKEVILEGLQSAHTEVLRTVAAEQEILRLICTARAAMQESSAASLQHLAKMEQFCGKTIQKALSLVDSGRTKMLYTSHQVQYSVSHAECSCRG